MKKEQKPEAVRNPAKNGEPVVPRRFRMSDIAPKKNRNNNNQKRGDGNRQNRERRERRPEPVAAPMPVTYQIDDHPRAMVLCFDRKAVEDIKPRKYTSGYEIFRVPMALARLLYAEEFLIECKKATELPFMDKSFVLVEGENLDKLVDLAKTGEKDLLRDKTVRQFYHYMSYFLGYAKENNTAVAFDF